MQLSDLVTNTNSIGFTAGEAIAANDLVVIERHTKKGWKAVDTTFAAAGTMDEGIAQTSEATGRIVAQTSIVAVQTRAFARQAVVKDNDCNIFTLTSGASGLGAILCKFAPDGKLLYLTNVDATADVTYNHQLLLLSNGNVAAIWVAGTTLKYYIRNQVGSQAGKSTTTIDAVQSVYFAAISLSGGGVGILYQPSYAPLTSKFLTYDNSGIAVLAATTVLTRTGTSGGQYHKMLQLANGNIAAAIASNNTISSIGLHAGVFNISGAIVTGFTIINAVSVAQYPEIATTPSNGNFAISYLDGTNQSVYVFNSAMVQQGSTITFATTVTGSGRYKLLTDGATDFVAITTSSAFAVLQKITQNGTKRAEKGHDLTTSLQSFSFDAFCERGLIFCAGMSSAAAASPIFWTIDADTGALLVGQSATSFGTSPVSVNGSYTRVIPGGDFTFIALYDYANAAATNLCIGKYSNASIIGPAQTNVSAGEQGAAYSEKGSYSINKVGGLPGKAFDHSANLIAGNTGFVSTYGLKIKD